MSLLSFFVGILVMGVQQTASFEEKLVIGLLRFDSMMIPFALYDDKHWKAPWPKVDDSTCHNSLTDMERPWFEGFLAANKEWKLWSQGNLLTTMKGGQPLQVQNHCENIWGIETDAPKKVADYWPTPIQGIALSSSLPLVGFVKVEDPIEMDSLSGLIRPALDLEESQQLPQQEPWVQKKLPFRSEDRASIEPELEAYQSQLESDSWIIYFKATREYENPLQSSDRECHPITLFKGWIVKRGDRQLLVGKELDFTDCDMVFANVVEALGVLSIDNRSFVILRRIFYEAETYEILEVRPNTIQTQLQIWAGGC